MHYLFEAWCRDTRPLLFGEVPMPSTELFLRGETFVYGRLVDLSVTARTHASKEAVELD